MERRYRVSCFRFLGMQISDNIALTHNKEGILKKAPVGVFFP